MCSAQTIPKIVFKNLMENSFATRNSVSLSRTCTLSSERVRSRTLSPSLCFSQRFVLGFIDADRSRFILRAQVSDAHLQRPKRCRDWGRVRSSLEAGGIMAAQGAGIERTPSSKTAAVTFGTRMPKSSRVDICPELSKKNENLGSHLVRY